MKYTIILVQVLVVVLLSGCGKPAPPMSKEQIVNILMDVHIAEALINGHHPPTMKDSLEKRYLRQVLDKWGASHDEFESEMNYMHGDPNYMKDIYESVEKQVNDYSRGLDDSETKNMMKDTLLDKKTILPN